MPRKKGPSLGTIAKSLMAEITQPVSIDEFTQHILERYPSQAKDPSKRVRDYLHLDGFRDGIIFLDAQTITSVPLALRGVRFRVPLEQEEIKQGIVFAEPGFTPFIKSGKQHGWMAVSAEFSDANDHPIPSRVIALPLTMPGFLGGEVTIERPVFELRDWLRVQRAHAGDSLLLSILDLGKSHFRLEFEPRAKRRTQDIEAQNRALSDLVYQLLQDTYDERLVTSQAIPTAFARLPTARDYPGDHWIVALEQDGRMRVTDWQIVPSDHKFPFDRLFEKPGSSDVREQPFTREQGRQVYRFRAKQNYGKKERGIEILGKHTLADFDEVMREAFDLDTFDHLSEFTRITRRGKGKKPHEQQYGEINPFEPTAAMKLRIAGLGLNVGAELEYVYDFGDWIKHTLVLEGIGSTERGAEYPRVIPSSKIGRELK